ncbi:MAG: hypothetical protein J6B22_00795 [Clostridia bacterium]|nr:hypothetical protein [Clostridia bacterium]
MIFPLVGNNKIAPSLENALREHRIPHAILIDGDVGTGRHTLANFLSLAAVCSGDLIPCDECKNCRMASSSNHPNIRYITPEKDKKSIAVAQIRELKNDAYIKPHQAKNKIFIIDPADSLNPQCQNALLKILEEPPENTIFILVAESKASLLDTVLSRCVVLSLNVPSFEEASHYLQSKTNFDKAEIENALNVSRNNIGKALMLLNGNATAKVSEASKKFLELALKGDQMGMLSCLYPFENSRIDAERLIKDLKLLVANEIKKNPSSVRAAALLKFYNKLPSFEESLVTNVTLSLLFADLTATAKEYIS